MIRTWRGIVAAAILDVLGDMAASYFATGFLDSPAGLAAGLPFVVCGAYIGVCAARQFRLRRAAPPQGVRLHLVDGTVVECGVLRDAEQDHRGLAMWTVVPLEELTALPAGMEVGMMPPHTVVSLRVQVPR